MKAILSERNLVVVLFVLVLVTFSLAQEDSKKIERIHNSVQAKAITTSTLYTQQLQAPVKIGLSSTPLK